MGGLANIKSGQEGCQEGLLKVHTLYAYLDSKRDAVKARRMTFQTCAGNTMQ